MVESPASGVLPLITAAVTCYNAEATIERAIRSATKQDWPNLEVVVVDDASADGSVEIIEALARHDARIRLVRHPRNLGVAAARNSLVEAARGEFIAFFDDDDESLPHRISRQYERVTAYEREYGAGMAICHAARIQKFPNGYERYEGAIGAAGDPAPGGEAVLDRGLFGKVSKGVVGSCATCSQMARRKHYQSVGGFDPALRRSEDSDIAFRFALAGACFPGIAEPLVIQSMTSGAEKRLDAENEATEVLFEKYRDYLDRKNWLSFSRTWLELRRAYLIQDRMRFLRLFAYLAARHPIKTVQRAYWSLPARRTRSDFRRWHHGAYEARSSSDS